MALLRLRFNFIGPKFEHGFKISSRVYSLRGSTQIFISHIDKEEYLILPDRMHSLDQIGCKEAF